MKCKICGSESGKYPLCRECYIKKENGDIINCKKCGKWHYKDYVCNIETVISNDTPYLYEAKSYLISKSEQSFFDAIRKSVPDGYFVFPQINLAAFIKRTDDSAFHNELFRNVDFLITDAYYRPQIIIEINDQTHLTSKRKDRDEKVKKICQEAGIPLIIFWTSYGINQDYIKGKIDDMLKSLPVARVHHFDLKRNDVKAEQNNSYQNNNESVFTKTYQPKSKKGCYIATCVYGSYDCPNVWVLRRFRDFTLSKTWYGRSFIRLYYLISPVVVKCIGQTAIFNKICRKYLDRMVSYLKDKGFEDKPYKDI